MRGVYSVVSAAVAITAAQDLVYLASSSTIPLRILRIEIGQNTEVGDAQDESLRVRFRRSMTTVGSGGSSITPAKYGSITADPAASFTARANDTTAASGGTIEEIFDGMQWNVRNGYIWLPTPKEELLIPVSTKFAFNLPTAPADSVTTSVTMLVEEML
jgi:hypothetical protein